MGWLEKGGFWCFGAALLGSKTRIKPGFPLWDPQWKPGEDLRSSPDETPKGSPGNTTLASFVLVLEILGAGTLEAHDVTREQSLLQCIQLAWLAERLSPTS